MKIRFNSHLAILTIVLLFTLAAEKAEAAPSLTITLSTSSLTFPDQDPDLFPVTQQNGAAVRITISTKATGGALYSCNALALGDLMSGPSIIPISNVKWTAVMVTGDAGESFSSGTLFKSTPVLVARGLGNDNPSSSLQGDLTFFIDNLWTYATGNYSQAVNFTVSIP